MKRLFALMLLASATLPAYATIEVTIDPGQVSAQPIAIVPMKGANSVQVDMSRVIESDLYRTGEFRPLSRDSMREQPSDSTLVHFDQWRAVNADSLVVGNLRENERGQVIARFWLLDPVRQQQLLGFDMPAANAADMRRVAHQIADLVYEKLTGKPGFFNTQIAYIAAAGYGYQRRWQLMVADADGENARAIATSREPLMSPAWSPDRKRLAYVGYERGRMSIYVQSVDTGQVRKLVSEKGINGSPAWSPDGKLLAVTLSFENNPDIYVMDPENGGSRRRLTDHYGIDTEASWAPDGQSLVFTSDRGGSPQIYRVSVNGGEPERLTFEGKQNLKASYSPDGKQLVLVNMQDGRYRIALFDLATKDLRLITDGSLDESPQFSPNGAVVIYATTSGGRAEVATVSVDGRVHSRVRQAVDIREPAWSPLNR